MKKIVLILAGIIIVVIALLFMFNEFQWRQIYRRENIEPVNNQIKFAGNSNGYYSFGDSYQNPDGSVYIISRYTNRTMLSDYVALIKLAPDLHTIWEKKTRIGKFSWNDFLLSLKREKNPEQKTEVLDTSVWQDKIYVLITELKGNSKIPNILEFDLNGKLLKKIKLKLELETNTEQLTLMQNNYAYISYLNGTDKMICLAQIDVKSAEIVSNAMLFYKKLNPQLTTFAVDSSDSTAYIAAIDKKTKGNSFFVSKNESIKEYFRTKPLTEIYKLKFIDDKLLGVVKEDSLLEIIDFTDPGKPLILVSDVPEYSNYRVSDLNTIDGSFYLVLNIPPKTQKNNDMDIRVLKYNSEKNKPLDILIPGDKNKQAEQLLVTSDKHLIILGTSFNAKSTMGFRVFTCKIKL